MSIITFDKYPFPISDGKKAKDHQIETAKFHLLNKRAYNLSTMGTGKTLSALWANDFLLCNEKIGKVLIAAPLSTIESVWFDEIRANLPHRKAVILHGSKSIRKQLLGRDAHFYIVNHDGAKVINDELVNAKFDTFIIDELTCCKNFTIDRTKAIKRIADECQAVWGLTGEPTPNSPTEAFGQAKVVNPDKAPRYFSHFRDATMVQFDEYTYVPKIGWEQKVYDILSPYIRYTLEDVEKDMPPITFETRKFPMTAEQKKYYDQMYKDFVIEYENGMITAVNAGVKANKLAQIGCGSVRNTETGSVLRLDNKHKLNELLAVLQETKKLIVFVPFRDSINAVSEFLTSKNISNAVVHGDVQRSSRVHIFDDFQRRDLRVLVMHPKTSAHGLTLTRSHTIIWMGPYADNEIFSQANARIRRISQNRPQLVLRFECSPVERHIYSIIDRKIRMSTTLLELFK